MGLFQSDILCCKLNNPKPMGIGSLKPGARSCLPFRLGKGEYPCSGPSSYLTCDLDLQHLRSAGVLFLFLQCMRNPYSFPTNTCFYHTERTLQKQEVNQRVHTRKGCLLCLCGPQLKLGTCRSIYKYQAVTYSSPREGKRAALIFHPSLCDS